VYEKGTYAKIRHTPPFPSLIICSSQESVAHLLSRMRSEWVPAVDLFLPQQQTREGQSCLQLSKSGSIIAKSDGRQSLFVIVGRVRTNVRYWKFQFDSSSVPVNVFISYEVKVLCVVVCLSRVQRMFLNRCVVIVIKETKLFTQHAHTRTHAHTWLGERKKLCSH